MEDEKTTETTEPSIDVNALLDKIDALEAKINETTKSITQITEFNRTLLSRKVEASKETSTAKDKLETYLKGE